MLPAVFVQSHALRAPESFGDVSLSWLCCGSRQEGQLGTEPRCEASCQAAEVALGIANLELTPTVRRGAL